MTVWVVIILLALLDITIMKTSPGPQGTLQQWLDYLLSIHPSEIDMGLERVTIVADRMALLKLSDKQQYHNKIITIAGTNGKGSSCTMLETILAESGLRVGVYSSPHILDYNERVRICGNNASDSALIEAFCAIDAARQYISLTFFEFATLAGLYLFKAANLDVIILEVGLGGRLDATNIIDPDLSVITAIDIDHQSYLGDTRELIGREKAGIFRTHRTAIIGEPNIPQSVKDYSQQISTPVYAVERDFSYQKLVNSWQFTGKTFAFSTLPLPNLPLPNAATVLAILEQLKPIIWGSLSYEQCQQYINQGLSKAKLEGRFELISLSPTVYADVAHNPHAANFLALQLAEKRTANNGKGRIFALCGMLKDKDIQGVINQLLPQIDQWYLTGLDCERGAGIGLLEKAFLQACEHYQPQVTNAKIEYEAFSVLSDAWDQIKLQIKPDDVVIVFGSFYTVSGVKLLIGRK